MLGLTGIMAPSAHATANYIFHEQTSSFVATPTCPDGGTDVTAGRYVDNVDRSNMAGFQVFSSETYSLRGKIEFQFFTDQVKVYYTTDGTAPAGALGVGTGTTQVINATYATTYSDQSQSCGVIDVISAQIPAQPVGTTVKYIIGAYHTGGGDEIFANSGTCATCTACTTASCATLFEYQSIASTLTVNSLADPGDGTCDALGTGDGCTFREALQAANNLTGPVTVGFAAGLSGTIALGDVLPFIIADVSIQGPGANSITVQRSATAEFRIFTISNFATPGPTVSISGLTIAGGKASGTAPDNWGGALYNDHGTITLQNCVFSGNSADQGGALANDGSGGNSGTFTITNCAFNNNSATTLGGAVYNGGAGGTVGATLRGCTFSGNTTSGSSGLGGALFNDGFGGGNATMSLTNCTLGQNSATGNGGAIYNSGTGGTAVLSLTSCTFNQNSAPGGGAVYNDGSNFGSATLTLGNTLFKAGATGGTLTNNFGAITSSGYNLSSDAANGDAQTAPGGFLNATGDLRNTDPLLGALANNGGPTQTIALLSGSPALDKGKDLGTIGTDQRGRTRPYNNSAVPNASGGDGSDIGAYEEQQPTISIADVSIAEGNSGPTNLVFTVTLSQSSPQATTVAYATANGTATAGSDYAATTGTLTIPANQSSATISVPISGDTTVEPAETFVVNLTTPTNATIADNQATGTITNDDQATLSINDVTVAEGNTGTTNLSFTVTLSQAILQNVTVNYATQDGTALQPADYTAASGALTFTPGGSLTRTVTLAVKGDTLDEINENLRVNLSGAVGATIFDAQGIGTITDDDPNAVLTIGDVTFNETTGPASNATFRLTLSPASGKTVTINYTTADGTAKQPDDYIARSGSLVFLPGQTTKTLTVGVRNENIDEENEFFKINLSGIGGATLGDNQGICTIVNDDTSAISINNVTIIENDSGPKNLKFTVTLSNPNSRNVTVAYATADNTATAGSDYVATSGTVIFNPGQLIKTFIVQSTGDLLDENNETFLINLSSPVNAVISDAQGIGTLNDDDLAPTLSISDAVIAEGNSGTANATFTVTLSEVSGRPVSINFATADGTAKQPDDYNALTGTVTFAPGQTSRTIAIGVKGDTIAEPNETFRVNLSGAVGANIANNQGIGTITNDDAAPLLFEDEPSE